MMDKRPNYENVYRILPDAQEVFNNFRRTGYPKLVPNNYPGNATIGQFFRRFLYPE